LSAITATLPAASFAATSDIRACQASSTAARLPPLAQSLVLPS
jgi:hypothetical protein